jgi:hypothetical protein
MQSPGFLSGPTCIVHVGVRYLSDCFQLPSAFWRHVFLTQPPVTSITLNLDYKRNFQCFRFEHEDANLDGTKLEDYVDALIELSEAAKKPKWVELRVLRT